MGHEALPVIRTYLQCSVELFGFVLEQSYSSSSEHMSVCYSACLHICNVFEEHIQWSCPVVYVIHPRGAVVREDLGKDPTSRGDQRYSDSGGFQRRKTVRLEVRGEQESITCLHSR